MGKKKRTKQKGGIYIYFLTLSYAIFWQNFPSFFSVGRREFEKKQQFQETLGSFNDPMVQNIPWSSLKGRGRNFKTHNLIQNEQGNLEYKVSFVAMVFSMILILFGIMLGSLFLLPMILSGFSTKFDFTSLVPIILFSIPTIVGIFMLRGFRKKRVFDFQTGYFSVGKIPENNFDDSNLKNMTSLRDIWAIQVIGKDCGGSNWSRNYRSYEINLILKDASRVNVIDHSNLSQILLDAQQISSRLNVPLWDVSSFWELLDDNPSLDPIGEREDDKNIKSL